MLLASCGRCVASPEFTEAAIECADCMCLVWWQVVKENDARASSVILSAPGGHAGVELHGFESRLLHASRTTRRHLYITEWQPLRKHVDRVETVLVLCGKGIDTATSREHATWSARRKPTRVAVVLHHAQDKLSGLAGLLWALELSQVQEASPVLWHVWLLSAGTQCGIAASGSAEQAGRWGIARCARA